MLTAKCIQHGGSDATNNGRVGQGWLHYDRRAFNLVQTHRLGLNLLEIGSFRFNLIASFRLIRTEVGIGTMPKQECDPTPFAPKAEVEERV